MTTVFYLVPTYKHPSWGIALLEHHVRLLARNSIPARVVLETPPKRRFWQRLPADCLTLERLRPRADDVLVVPENKAGDETVAGLDCRKVVFVQGSFLIHTGLGGDRNGEAPGVECAMVILPHQKCIMEDHYGLEAHVVPPYVDSGFFLDSDSERARRHRRILVYPKPAYLAGGLPDYDILRSVLGRRITEEKRPWEIEALVGKSHETVARLMKTSAFFVNVNSHEGFNTTVPEAMAAGCINICYEAVGGQDYLRDGHNAYVFPNHHIYPMIDRVLDLIDRYDRGDTELDRVRANGLATAGRYTESETERELVAFFRSFLASS